MSSLTASESCALLRPIPLKVLLSTLRAKPIVCHLELISANKSMTLNLSGALLRTSVVSDKGNSTKITHTYIFLVYLYLYFYRSVQQVNYNLHDNMLILLS